MSDRTESRADLRAGAAEVKITPPVGLDLSGYAGREGPSIGMHDDLWCRAIVLEAGGTRLALVALDLLGIDFGLDTAIRREVGIAAGTASEAVLLNCSHTHAGPAVASLRGLGAPNADYVSQLPGWAAEAAARAGERVRPVNASFGTAPVRVGINRRERTVDGVVLGRNPDGVVDTQVRVLRFDEVDGGMIAVAFSHACHGTTLGMPNRMISAEWMGDACRRLRERVGDATPVFLQGCCGEINPDRGGDERSFAEVERLGGMAAAAVMTASAGAEPVQLGALQARLARIELPLQDPPDAAMARTELARCEQNVRNARGESRHPYWIRALEGLVAYTRGVVKLAEEGAHQLTMPFAVQAMAVGDVGVVALSGEVFFELARMIEERSPFAHTVVLGYSNGCTGYVPTAAAFAEGGYEPGDSFWWYGTLPLAPEAGERMVEAAVGMLAEVRSAQA